MTPELKDGTFSQLIEDIYQLPKLIDNQSEFYKKSDEIEVSLLFQIRKLFHIIGDHPNINFNDYIATTTILHLARCFVSDAKYNDALSVIDSVHMIIEKAENKDNNND